MTRTIRLKSGIVNSAIGVVIVVAFVIFAATFFSLPRLHDIVFSFIAISNFVQRLISLIFLIIAWQLYMRKRLAWIMVVTLLSVSLFMHFVLHHHYISFLIIACQIYALIILLVCHSEFKRPSSRLSLKHAVIYAIIANAAILINAVIGRSALSEDIGAPLSFQDSLVETIAIIFGESSNFPRYEWFILCFVWFCFAACIILILRSAIANRNASDEENALARELINKYSQNSSSYLILEDDKTLFFGKEVQGVIAYGVVGNVVIVCGDPVCAPDDFMILLSEFKAFCSECSYQSVFLGATSAFIKKYEMLGYSHVKAGEEARFHLQEYQLAGGKMQKIRTLINHANNAGLTTVEYKPNECKDEYIEKAIDDISESWLEGKKSGKLGFTVGGVGLENPLDRRYFYAVDESEKIVAFNVFLPYAEMKGYLADVTRRFPDAPNGVTEKLIFDGFMVFRDEGALWGSMGLAPLANVREEGITDEKAVKLLEFIYEKCNGFYGFKDLHHAKEKYSPSEWTPGYFVYSTRSITPEIAYAIIKIQNPGGVKDFLLSNMKKRFK